MRAGVNNRAGGTSDGARGGGRGEQRGPRDTEGRQTDRVGPYRLSRCIERGTQQGDLYLARDMHTGEAALVARPVLDEGELLPTTPLEVLDQYPSASVEVSLKSSDSPAYRAVVIRVPLSASPAKLNEELTAVAEDMPKMMERALERPDVRDHLLSPPLTRAQRLRGRARRHVVRARQLAARRWKDVALAAAVAGFLGLLWQRPEPAPVAEPEVVVAASTSDSAPAALGNTVAETALDELDVEPAMPLFESSGAMRIALDMPKKPFKGQKRPPCKQDQDELVGGCWVAVKKAPPCGDSFYEHEGTCYAPMMVRGDGSEAPRSISR